jgi:hypothetical protein
VQTTAEAHRTGVTLGDSRRALSHHFSRQSPHRDAAAQLGKLIRESRGAATAADRLVALTG